MVTMMVWLLIVTSNGTHGEGNVSVLAKFSAANECSRVEDLIPAKQYVSSRCVQATILVEK